mmetsp:Transcript_18415/g.30268  ORF Transcript_18415/g.30268 Transcript_18415/m.30268 type:complete len:198 (-) Transcript_18415:142-735(-)
MYSDGRYGTPTRESRATSAPLAPRTRSVSPSRSRCASSDGRRLNSTFGGTNSSRGTFFSRGEVFAVTHPQILTGYKLPNSEFRRPAKSAYADSFRLPVTSKPLAKQLLPYNQDAQRNRLSSRFPGEAIPGRRYCKDANSSQIEFKDPSMIHTIPKSRHYVTESRNHLMGMQQLPVGATANPQIMAEKTRWLHRKQSL